MIYIIGDGGHARVVAELIETLGHEWEMISRDNEEDMLATANGRALAIGIGMKKYRADICQSLMQRHSLAGKYKARGFKLPDLVHASAIVARTAFIDDGTQVMAGAIVQARTWIMETAIVNTGAQVDHDCAIGGGVHIGPGAIVCGGCTIGACTLIGANATVLPGISIGNHVVVGAAQVVKKDIPS